MRLIKFFILIIAASILTFGSAQLLYAMQVDFFQALLLQGLAGVLAGGLFVMRICEDYDSELIERFKHERSRIWRHLRWSR